MTPGGGVAPPLRRLAMTTRQEAERPMPNSDKPLKAKRYRIYFWLMDFSTAVMALLASLLIAEYFVGPDIHDIVPPTIYLINAATFQIVGLIILPFLICAKFLRDDYLDALWHRSVTILAYSIALIVFAAFWISSIYYFTVGPISQGPQFISWLAAETKWGEAIVEIWISYMILFVAIFQVLRWKDSR
jgi:hypothetical protein